LAVNVVDVPANIVNRCVPNANPETYCYTNLISSKSIELYYP